MMDEKIDISLDRIRNCIQEINRSEFTTAEVIKKYFGRFCSNIGTPATYSFNAQFGALLKRNETLLDIIEIASNESIKDDHEHNTSTSRWKLIT
jgi:hypothetical protein